MANSALSLLALSQVALSAGTDAGFNAAEVELWCDPDDLHLRLIFKFGDREEMARPRMRTPCEWARSEDLNAECIRQRCIVELPHFVVHEASYDLKQRLTEALLELAPSG